MRTQWELRSMDEQKWTLKPHQELALTVMDSNDGLLLGYGMGTGKTAIALHWILRHLKSGDIENALVVCPANLIGSWWLNVDKMLRFEGVTVDDVQLLKDRVTILSYAKTYHLASKKEVRMKNGRTFTKKEYSLTPEVDKYWGVIFYDESHYLGAHGSAVTRAAITLGHLAAHRYPMSGTPTSGGKGVENFAKLYGQLMFAIPGIWKNWTEFATKYILKTDMWHNPAVYNSSACRELLSRYGIACRLEDVVDMPEYLEVDIPCTLAEPKMYADFAKDKWAKHGVDLTSSGAKFTKMRQICSGSLIVDEDTTRSLRCSKDDALTEIVNGTDGKIVIFCDFRASVDRCVRICTELGRDVVRYDGGAERDDWMRFQDGDADVIVCQYRSGSVGIDLSAASYTVFFEPCYSATDFDQAKHRMWRQGQTKTTVFYYLYTLRPAPVKKAGQAPDYNTIDSKVMELVRNGVTVNNQLLEEWAINGILV